MGVKMLKLIQASAVITLVLIMSFSSCTRTDHKLNILFVPLQQKSHTFMHIAVAKELKFRGHNVYIAIGSIFRPYIEDKIKNTGIEIINFEQNVQYCDFHGGNIDKEIASTFLHNKSSGIRDMRKVWSIFSRMTIGDCESMFTDLTFKGLVKSNNINLVYIDAFNPSPCNVLLPYNLSIPFVIGAFVHSPWIYGQPSLPSFEPHHLLQYTDDMKFFQRMINLIFSVVYYNNLLNPEYGADSHLLESYAPGENDWNILKNKALMVFVLRDIISEWPKALLPNVITVPGVSYSDAKPLAETFANIIKDSEEVIIVSFGSMGGYMPQKHMYKMIKAFEMINQTVIMSFTGDIKQYSNLSSNIHIVKWFPQNDLLGHKKIKLFITHGGHNGQMEAIYHGIPMIYIPLFADQPHNAFVMTHHGVALTLNLFDFTTADMTDSINEVLNNNTYSQNAKLRSQLLREKPGKPPTEVISDWIEYVSRNGAAHLRSKAIDMPIYKKFMLDVILFLFVIATFVAVFIYVFCRVIYYYICNSSRKKLKIN